MQKRFSAVLAVFVLLFGIAVGVTYSQQQSSVDVGDTVQFSDISADGKTVVFSGQCFTCPENYYHLFVYNTADGSFTKVEEIAPNPWGAAISRDGKKAFVAAFGDDGECPCSIGVYDVEKKEKSKIDVGGKVPQGIRSTADGKQIYYTDAGRGGGLRGIDTTSGQENYELLISGYVPLLVNLSADSKTGYLTGIVSGNETTVKVVDIAGKKELATIGTGLNTRGELHGAAVSADGKLMAVTESARAGSKVAIIDLAGNKVLGTVEVGAYPQEAAFSPDAKTLYVANMNGKSVSVVDVAGLKTTSTVDVGCGAVGVQVSPDGKSVYVGCMKEGKVVTLKF